MTKKRTTYSDDIQETFEEKVSSKEAQSIAADIKKLQKSFTLWESFKATLLGRLEWVYRVDELTSGAESFSFFRTFSTILSFALMFWVVYIVYDAKQTNIYQQTMIEESFMGDVPEGVQHMGRIEILQTENEIYEESTINTWEDEDFTPLSRDILESQDDVFIEEIEGDAWAPEPEFSQRVEFIIEKESQQDEYPSPLSEDVMNDDIPNTWSKQDEQSVQEQAGEESSDDSSLWEDSSVDMMPATMMMEMQEMDDGEDFPALCEMYEGEYNREDNTCEFSDGSVCTQENIETCAP